MAYVYIAMSTITKEHIIEMLKTIEDPELGVDIWTLGLIYDIKLISKTKIEILMTFTSPLCPVGEQLKEEVFDAMKMLKFTEVDLKITFEPAWKPSDELKVALGLTL